MESRKRSILGLAKIYLFTVGEICRETKMKAFELIFF